MFLDLLEGLFPVSTGSNLTEAVDSAFLGNVDDLLSSYDSLREEPPKSFNLSYRVLRKKAEEDWYLAGLKDNSWLLPSRGETKKEIFALQYHVANVGMGNFSDMEMAGSPPKIAAKSSTALSSILLSYSKAAPPFKNFEENLVALITRLIHDTEGDPAKLKELRDAIPAFFAEMSEALGAEGLGAEYVTIVYPLKKKCLQQVQEAISLASRLNECEKYDAQKSPAVKRVSQEMFRLGADSLQKFVDLSYAGDATKLAATSPRQIASDLATGGSPIFFSMQQSIAAYESEIAQLRQKRDAAPEHQRAVHDKFLKLRIDERNSLRARMLAAAEELKELGQADATAIAEALNSQSASLLQKRLALITLRDRAPNLYREIEDHAKFYYQMEVRAGYKDTLTSGVVAQQPGQEAYFEDGVIPGYVGTFTSCLKVDFSLDRAGPDERALLDKIDNCIFGTDVKALPGGKAVFESWKAEYEKAHPGSKPEDFIFLQQKCYGHLVYMVNVTQGDLEGIRKELAKRNLPDARKIELLAEEKLRIQQLAVRVDVMLAMMDNLKENAAALTAPGEFEKERKRLLEIQRDCLVRRYGCEALDSATFAIAVRKGKAGTVENSAVKDALARLDAATTSDATSAAHDNLMLEIDKALSATGGISAAERAYVEKVLLEKLPVGFRAGEFSKERSEALALLATITRFPTGEGADKVSERQAKLLKDLGLSDSEITQLRTDKDVNKLLDFDAATKAIEGKILEKLNLVLTPEEITRLEAEKLKLPQDQQKTFFHNYVTTDAFQACVKNREAVSKILEAVADPRTIVAARITVASEVAVGGSSASTTLALRGLGLLDSTKDAGSLLAEGDTSAATAAFCEKIAPPKSPLLSKEKVDAAKESVAELAAPIKDGTTDTEMHARVEKAKAHLIALYPSLTGTERDRIMALTDPKEIKAELECHLRIDDLRRLTVQYKASELARRPAEDSAEVLEMRREVRERFRTEPRDTTRPTITLVTPSQHTYSDTRSGIVGAKINEYDPAAIKFAAKYMQAKYGDKVCRIDSEGNIEFRPREPTERHAGTEASTRLKVDRWFEFCAVAASVDIRYHSDSDSTGFSKEVENRISEFYASARLKREDFTREAGQTAGARSGVALANGGG